MEPFFFFFLILFYFQTLQHCVSFAKHRNESATGTPAFPIPNPPPSSLPIPSLWVVPVHQPQASNIVHRISLSPLPFSSSPSNCSLNFVFIILLSSNELFIFTLNISKYDHPKCQNISISLFFFFWRLKKNSFRIIAKWRGNHRNRPCNPYPTICITFLTINNLYYNSTFVTINKALS